VEEEIGEKMEVWRKVSGLDGGLEWFLCLQEMEEMKEKQNEEEKKIEVKW
jgi:hypothetical protein